MNRRILAVFLVTAIGALGIYSGLQQPPPQTTERGSSPSANSSGAAIQDASRTNSIEGKSIPSASQRNSPRSTPMHLEFERARDLGAFIERLSNPQSAEEKAYAAKALQYCFEVSNSSISQVVDALRARLPKDGINNSIRTQLIADSAMRCKSLEGTKITRSQIGNLSDAAAEAGSPLILADRLFEIDRSKGRPDALAILEGVMSSQDPNALIASIPFLRQPGLLTIAGLESEASQRVLGGALVLVACDLGMECGSESRYLIPDCTTLNKCDVRSVEEMVMRSITPNDRATLEQARTTIRNAITAQNYQLLGLRR